MRSQHARTRWRKHPSKLVATWYTVDDGWCLVLSAAFLHGNGVTRRTQKVIQGGDNGHVGRPCEVSPAPPCQELFCELRGL